MEAGWARMNDLIVIQASQVGVDVHAALGHVFQCLYCQGLCAYLLKNVVDAASRGIVIGHDHRHNSADWARLTAAVFLSRNVKVFLLRGLVHTPLWVLSSSCSVAKIWRSYKCSLLDKEAECRLWCNDHWYVIWCMLIPIVRWHCSKRATTQRYFLHNPSCQVYDLVSCEDDNGFKVRALIAWTYFSYPLVQVYWENAVQVRDIRSILFVQIKALQIIGPHDTGIAQAILDNLEPRIRNDLDIDSSPLSYDPTDEMKESYFTLIHSLKNPGCVIKCLCYVHAVMSV